jgi:hypothetical protein
MDDRVDVLTKYTEFVGTRITQDQRDLVGRLVKEGVYSSESELVRAALDLLLEGEQPEFGVGDKAKTSTRLVVELPGKNYELLKLLVELELILSPQEGLRQAIQPYFDSQLELLEENRLTFKHQKKRQMDEKLRESSVNIPR